MINKEINELRTKIDNIKEETTQDMENIRKRTNIIAKQNGGPIQQNRTNRRQNLELKDEMVIKGKTE
jgi:hypothetical protein